MKHFYLTALLLLITCYRAFAAVPVINSFSPSSGAVGTVVTITGTDLDNATALMIGGRPAIIVSNSSTKVAALVMPGTVTGTVAITNSLGNATAATTFTITATSYPAIQQGNKLVGTGNVGTNIQQGIAVAVSADGNTAIAGGNFDNNIGAVWVYARSGNTWLQQGNKLVGAGFSGTIHSQGVAVALSADGNTAISGSLSDNSYQGAVWIFTRTGTTWSQQGSKLVGSGSIGAANQGGSVALSADGNTAIWGGPNDNSNLGAAWVFTRTGTTWSQQSKLVGTGNIGVANQGYGVALSADGNTALLGGKADNTGQGAAWVFTRTGNTWAQQGTKLIGTNIIASTIPTLFELSVGLNADGNTAVIGRASDNSSLGAFWVFTRTGTTWAQQGNKLTATGNIGTASLGKSLSLSADGNTVLVGGYADNPAIGAAWVFTRSGNTWFQQNKLVGTGYSGITVFQGQSVSLSADGATSIIGGYGDASGFGASWIFAAIPTVQTLPATFVTATTAILNGLVSDNGALTTVTIEYGTSPTLAGSSVATLTTGISPVAPGTGTVAFTSAISGLIPGGTYYFRINSTNSSGTASGNILSFTTGQAPNISYQTPNVYAINTAISPLSPVNTGGSVPATIYGNVTLFAGSGSQGSANGTGSAASFNNPYNAAIDNVKNLYIADYNNHLVRKITPGGIVTTFAGSGSPGATNGTGTGASFNFPGGVTTDAAGNVYVGDQNNNLIRRITPAGIVTTFAGNGSLGFTNGPNLSASFSSPAGLVFDRSGNLYVADRNNNVIRKISPAGTVSTFAGSGFIGSTNATGTAASFSNPTGLAADAADNIYVTDQNNNLIRKITPAGVVTTYAGTGIQGATDGAANAASFNKPFSLSVDVSGNLYIGDEFNHVIRQITPSGLVSTLAGTGAAGGTDGVGKAASFNYTAGVIPDGLGNLFITETIGQRIRKIIVTGYVIDKPLPAGLVFDQTTGIISGKPIALSAATNYTITAYNLAGSSSTVVSIAVTGDPPPNISYNTPNIYSTNIAISPLVPVNTGGPVPNIAGYGQVTTYAGTGAGGATNGAALTAATFNNPTRLALDVTGNAYVADRDNNLIRKIIAAGVASTVTTFATGMNQPNGTAVDASGNVYVADALSNSIKKITSTGIVSTLAGTGTQGSNNGPGTSATFYFPFGVAVDATGNVFVADTRNNLIRKINTTGIVSTLAGNGAAAFANGTGTAASFSDPADVVLDASGNIFVCDASNSLIRKITPAGVVTTYAGTTTGFANGTVTTASFNRPTGLAIDLVNNFYIADINNNQIRKIDAAGNVTTLAGSTTAGLINDLGAAARFNKPNDVQYDPSGALLVTDFGNNLIRKIFVTGYIIDKALPAGLSFDPATGVITGTPTVSSPPTTYTVTAYNIFGSSTTTLIIQVTTVNSLLITADNKTRIYGVANPSLTVSYTGFINGDDATKLTTQPAVTTTATITSPVGAYPITATGAASPNYTITYGPAGTLTITAAPRTLTFNPITTKSPLDPDFDPGAFTSTGDAIIYTSSDPTIAIIIAGKVHILKPGTVTITATVASRANYDDILPKSQTLIILDNPDDLIRIRPVVTPNGDNINDVLIIDGIQNYPENTLTLVNANGIAVFEQGGYNNVTGVFDGHSNITGKLQPQGTYYYSIRFIVNGEFKKKVGFVVLKY